MKERVLLEVHLEAVRRWAGEGQAWKKWRIPSKNLLLEIEKVRSKYDKVIKFEDDPWGPEWNPENTTLNWENICHKIGLGNKVDIVGVQTDLCVRKVDKELLNLGLDVQVLEELTMDLERLLQSEWCE
ncbi:hypothetical protein KJ845_00190 [Patescibacteria group bacterium]|nr:hypothetical protein [Patescibacteria group bacterium]